jgi:hypothetical protein
MLVVKRRPGRPPPLRHDGIARAATPGLRRPEARVLRWHGARAPMKPCSISRSGSSSTCS